MSKRRKYDVKNKRNFIIIIGLSIAIVGIFSLFIYNYSKAAKIEYLIESGSVLQDVEKNYLNLDDDAKLKVRWDGNYYLIYNEKKISLGKKVIAYNTIRVVTVNNTQSTTLNTFSIFFHLSSSKKRLTKCTPASNTNAKRPIRISQNKILFNPISRR